MLRAALAALALAAGCSTAPVVSWHQDEFLTPYPCIDDVCYALSDAERDRIGVSYAMEYCPAPGAP